MSTKESLSTTQRLPDILSGEVVLPQAHESPENPISEQLAEMPADKHKISKKVNSVRVLFGLALGLSLIVNIVLYIYLLTISNEAEELTASYTKLSTQYIKKTQEVSRHSQETELQQNHKDYQIKKLQLAVDQAEAKAKDIQNQLASKKSLEILSSDGKETNKKLQEMLRLSQLIHEESKKQMQILTKANSTINDEVQ